MDYPPPEKKVKLAKFFQMIQVGFFGYVFMGDKVMEALGAHEPSVLAMLHEVINYLFVSNVGFQIEFLQTIRKNLTV